ncbi:MAG: hypothetical protein ABIR96_06825, partial [Bdellovibrionota bacterium]
GNLPIEILYPLADTDVIPISFPARLNVTFRIAPQLTSLDASQANAFSTWTLHVITQNEAPRPIKDFIFTETQIPRHFSSTIVIDEPGYYLLTPKGLDPSQSFNGFKMRVSDRKDLGTKINQMLDDYDHSQDKPLEIRQE